MTLNIILSRLKKISRIDYKNAESLTEEKIKFIEQCLHHNGSEIVAQAYWAIGQIGINHPEMVKNLLDRAFMDLHNTESCIREKALFAIGRTGRANIDLVSGRIKEIIELSKDPTAKVRMSMIWACENIANTNSKIFEPHISIFEHLLDDPDEKYVRGEAPEIFRVIGKTEPRIVEKSLLKLKEKLNDSCRVTRIHAAGAIRIIEKNLSAQDKLNSS